MKQYYVYLLSNKNNTVIYTGITSDLIKRVYHHKIKKFKGFTSKYNCDKLVYFEVFSDVSEAILREKQIKSGSRNKKEILINLQNKDWEDLSEGWVFDCL
ncbi:MAG: GIY-YIG nuclease family protein [Flavobacteriaceae bacterium]